MSGTIDQVEGVIYFRIGARVGGKKCGKWEKGKRESWRENVEKWESWREKWEKWAGNVGKTGKMGGKNGKMFGGKCLKLAGKDD